MNQFCDCTEDGFCERYNRHMGGRFREICAGINCDLGTAAAFRLQWAQESKETTMEKTLQKCTCWYTDSKNNSCPSFLCQRCLGKGYVNTATDLTIKPIPLLLKTNQCVGDAVAMTAAIYSLHKAHPGKYLTAIESLHPEVFKYNPNVASLLCPGDPKVDSDVKVVQMHYPAIHQSNQRGIHFMEAWCEFLSFALNDAVPLLTNKPHLYFQNDNLKVEPQDYWIVCSGGKNDFTNKLWGHSKYEKVLWDIFLQTGKKTKFIQVGANRDEHPKLAFATDMVGKTTLRELFHLVRFARGVLCGVSLLMHVAAALDKPCIVIAGGREPIAWNAYPRQQYLHTIGMLPCTDPHGVSGGACWRSRVVPLGDNEVLDSHPCLFPQEGASGTSPRPKCMDLIDPAYVADLVLKYDQFYTKGDNGSHSPLPL